jgi:metallo-beta-lactamase class B
MSAASARHAGFMAAVAGLCALAPLQPALAQQKLAAADIARQTTQELRSTLCPPPGSPPINFDTLYDPATKAMPPGRIFDNLYVVGLQTVVAWALTTSEGIILFESLFAHNVRELLLDGLTKVGLDPRDIKYVIIMHAHTDHYGGARYLQDTYGARIVMSVQDWEFMRSAPSRNMPPQFPRFDIAARDGSTVTLGDTTVNLYHTPGHTPGAMSAVFPVRDGGQLRYVGYLGFSGTAGRSQADLLSYMSSIDRFARIDPRVEIGISNHPMADGLLFKRAALDQRQPGEPHPFVLGNAGFRSWLTEMHDCAGVVLDQQVAAGRGASGTPPARPAAPAGAPPRRAAADPSR